MTSDPAGAPPALFLYDEDCGLCTRLAAWGARRCGGRVRFVGWRRVELEAYGLTDRQLHEAAACVETHGTHLGADAIAAALRGSPHQVDRFVGRTLRAPVVRGLAAATYRLVARHRHRLPGSTCRIMDLL